MIIKKYAWFIYDIWSAVFIQYHSYSDLNINTKNAENLFYTFFKKKLEKRMGISKQNSFNTEENRFTTEIFDAGYFLV